MKKPLTTTQTIALWLTAGLAITGLTITITSLRYAGIGSLMIATAGVIVAAIYYQHTERGNR